MLITADQIRAARALKNWSQTDLAERTGLAVPTIANIELGKQVPGKNTIEKIIDAFTLGGINFTERGVEKKDENSKFVHLQKKGNENIFLTLLEDVFYTLSNSENPNPEVLIFFGKDIISPPEVNSIYKKMRQKGIRSRELTEEGNTYLLRDLDEYRYVPSKFFVNNVSLLYDGKYAVVIGGVNKAPAEEVIIFNDPDLAKMQKNLFELLWSQFPKPKKSTAPEKEKMPDVKDQTKKKGRK